MEERELVKGTFKKMNIPAVVCLVLAIVLAIWYFDLSTDRWAASDEVMMAGIGALIFGILAIVFFVWMSGCNITVTNKRVYGIGAFRHRVDLPFDMISSVVSGYFDSIAVATSSGKICFWFVANRNEVFSAISSCLIERQGNSSVKPENQNTTLNNADELKKYKELLDSGIITQEEFDAKKKQLLGL